MITADQAERQANSGSSSTGRPNTGNYWDKRNSTPSPAPSGSSGTNTSSGSTTSSSGTRSVSYPNWGYYYSSADSYSANNPADPSYGAWNRGLTKEDAIAMWDSGDFSPELQDYLNAVAKSQHPMKKGKTLWQEAVETAYAVNNDGDFRTAWSILSNKYLAPGGAGVTDPSSSSSSFSGYSGGGGGYSSGGGGGGGQVRLTDPTSARGLLMQTMQQVLGRNPTEREYKDFLKTLNESEMANPQTVSIEGDNAVYSGGIDAGVLAADFAKSADDYKETQANKFYNAFMGALAGGA